MRWLYQHDGKTHGPISADEMKNLAEKGQLDRHDLAWEEGAEQAQAKPASAIVNFPGTTPDWLPDIAALETKKPSPTAEVPEWLEDVRLWIGLELVAKTSEVSKTSVVAPAAGAIPDWLDGWLAPASGAIKLAISVRKPASSSGQDVAKQTLEETGFDLVSGRILDQEKFDQWKEQKAPPTEASQHFLTNQSQFEVFRKARTAIECWVDDPDNRLHILHSDINQIIRSPGIQAVFRDFAGFGFRQKLEKHLAILVEKRRKRSSEPGA